MLSGINERMIKVLKVLSSKSDFVTSSVLAKELGVSTRTIRDDVKKLNSILSTYPFEILSKKGFGYKLKIRNKRELHQFFKMVNIYLSDNKINPVTPDERARYIVKRLLYSEGSIKLEKLMDELFVSESTIKNDLKEVKKILNKYNIRTLKDNSGIFVDGHEINKRFCIADYLVHGNEIDSNTLFNFISGSGANTDKLNGQFESADFYKIRNVILNKLKSEKIVVTDDILTRIAIHLFISLSRIKSGQSITLPKQNIFQLMQEKEYLISKRIIEQVERLFGIKLPIEEIAYTTLHLLGNRLDSMEMIGSDFKKLLGNEIYNLAFSIINEVDRQINGLELKDDQELIYSLGLHLKELLTRLNYKMNSRNPLLEKIKIKYPLAFEAGIIASKIIRRKTGFQISENEIGFLALHFGVAIERQKKRPLKDRKKVALVCASGMATSKLLLTKLSYLLDQDYYMIGNYGLYQLDELMIQKPDIIFTTVPIRDELPVPIIHVPMIFGDKDIVELKNKLKFNTIKNNMFSHFLKEDLFFPDLNIKSKEEILEFLTNKMIKLGYINRNIKNSILDREKISSTAVGNMVAIPHPILPNKEKSLICTAILKNEVQWSSSENVILVFIIILEQNIHSEFQAIFTSFYDMIYKEENVIRLAKQMNFDDFLRTINSIQ